MTIETASLRMLSPKTNMFSVGSTSKAWKIASVATGSTAEIREPNAKLNAKTEHVKQASKEGRVLPYRLYIYMCHIEGYGFQAIQSGMG